MRELCFITTDRHRVHYKLETGENRPETPLLDSDIKSSIFSFSSVFIIYGPFYVGEFFKGLLQVQTCDRDDLFE